MRRFEQPGLPGNFFEVDVSGHKLVVRFGPRDRSGKEIVRPFASEQAASDERDRLIADHVAKGYLETRPGLPPVEVQIANQAREEREAATRERARLQRETEARTRAAATIAREPDLEAQCRAAPDDPAPWAVYADWLIERGDPRGEIAALQLRGETKRAADVLAFHRARLAPEHVAFEFRYGFATGATIKCATLNEGTFDLAATTRALLASPMADFLTSLRLGLAGFGHENHWRPTFDAIADSLTAERLRVLRFDAYDYDECMMHWIEDADFSGRWDRFTHLEELRLRGDRMTVAPPTRLVTYVREATALGPGEIEELTRHARPALAHLELWGANGGDPALEPLLAARGVPKLRHLGIVNTTTVDELIPRLARSKLLPQLESLDFQMGTMSTRSTARLVEHARAFRHLAAIDLRLNQLSEDEVARIRGVLDNVITSDQRDVDDDDWGDEGPPEDVEHHRYAAEYE